MNFKEKEKLIEKIGMQFDEVAEIFSEETLLSMSMITIVGGNNTYCSGAQCSSGCNNNCGSGCSGGGNNHCSSGCTNSGGFWSTIASLGPVITAIGTIITAIK